MPAAAHVGQSGLPRPEATADRGVYDERERLDHKVADHVGILSREPRKRTPAVKFRLEHRFGPSGEATDARVRRTLAVSPPKN